MLRFREWLCERMCKDMPVRPPCGHRCDIEICLSYNWLSESLNWETLFPIWRAYNLNWVLLVAGSRNMRPNGAGNPVSETRLAQLVEHVGLLEDNGFNIVLRVGQPNYDEHYTYHWDDEIPLNGTTITWPERAQEAVEAVVDACPNVRYFQIENEPQYEWFWDSWNSATWVAFNQHLKNEVDYIRAANPANKIISPGLTSPEGDDDEQQKEMVNFFEKWMRKLFNTGADLPFDILAFHLWPWAHTLPKYYNRYRQKERGIGNRVETLREIMTEYGFDADEIWVTECGKRIGRDDGGFENMKSPTDQQNFFIDVVADLRQSEATNVFWWEYKGIYGAATSPLIFNDTGPNPVYQTFIDYCAKYNQRT